MTRPEREEQIILSWQINAQAWISAIRLGQVRSRVEVTNQAILDGVRALSPNSVLDLGCGEGWLSRTLAAEGVDVLGIDGSEELLESARQNALARYLLLDYRKLSPLSVTECFDLVVCNFSLLGKESVEHIFSQLPLLLNRGGGVLIQTLHRESVEQDKDGWRSGSWVGFSSEFRDPAPWYYRTRESWRRLFESNGLELVRIDEPCLPVNGRPVSMLMYGRQALSPDNATSGHKFGD